MNGDPSGETLARRYRILETLGQGGTGTVYKALDVRLQRVVALKVVRSKVASDTEFRARFLREADALARLNHPNIVQMYDEGEAEGLLYLAVQYIEGRSLREIMVQGKPLDLEYAIEIARQVGGALGYAHQRGVVHRDVKPSNILISTGGRIFLSDFGLAIEPGGTTLTTAGTIMGTVSYMSPEQASGKPVDARSDTFSLGVTLYEALTGRQPFTGDSIAEVLGRLVGQAPPPLRRFTPSLPPRIEQIVLKSLEKSPDQRYQAVDEFIAALTEARVPLLAMHSPPFLGRASGNPQVCDGRPAGGIDTVSMPAELQCRSAPSAPAPLTVRRSFGTRLVWVLVVALCIATAVFFVGKWAILTHAPAPSLSHSASPVASPQGRGGLSLEHLTAFAILALGTALALWMWRSAHRKRRAAVASNTSSTKPLTSDQQGQATSGTVKAPPSSGTAPRGSKLYGTRSYPLDEIQHAPTDEVQPYTSPGAAAEVLKPEVSSTARLVIANGPMRGRQFRLKDNFTIGSASDCDLVLSDDAVAGCSAKICLENDAYYLYQLGERTDTLVVVNDVGAQRQDLRDRDEIQIGKTIMLFIQQEGVKVAAFSDLSTDNLTVEAKRRLLEFDSVWRRLTDSVRHD